MNEKFDHLLLRAEQLIARIESVLPQPLTAPDWSQSVAWRYRKRSSGHGTLEPVRQVAVMRLTTSRKSTRRRRRCSATPSSSSMGAQPTTCC